MQRWLFRLSVLLAGALAGMVIFAPYCGFPRSAELLPRVGWLFAHDDLLRKTAVISAVGLWLTAVVFFRPRYYDYSWYDGHGRPPFE